MLKRIRNFITIFAIAILGLVILPNNVKAFSFSGYKQFTQIYLYKESANYEDKTCIFTGSDSYCSILLRHDSFPYDRLTYKLYANTFNLQKGKEYQFTFFFHSTFDISTFKNDFVFRVGKDDYTFTIVDVTNVKLEVERQGSNEYVTKVSLNFISPYDNGQVLSLWLNDTSNASVDTRFGAYKYYEIKEVEEELPYIDLNYSQVKDRFDTYFPDIDKIINYLNTNYDDDYDYVIRASIMSDTGRFYLLPSPKGTARTYLTGISNDDGTFNRIYLGKLGSSEDNYGYCTIYANDYNTAKTTIDECFSKSFSQSGLDHSFYTRYNQVDSNYILDYIQSTTSSLLLYSNNKIYNKPVHDGVEVPHEYNFYLDGKLYELNDEIPTFWEWLNSNEFHFRETYDASIYDLESLNFDFDLQDLYDKSLLKDLKIKIELSNYNDVDKIIENVSYNVFYKSKNTNFYEKTNFKYFPLEYEYVEEEHSLYLIFKNNLNMELYSYNGIRFSVDFKNSSKNILNIYTNVDYGSLELISSQIESFPGYQKVLISSAYKDYIISASESKSFSIIAKRENVLNLIEGDLIVFKYDFSTPIYSSDTFEILNEGVTLSPYPWGSYNGTYNDYVEFYITLDYLNNKIVLIRNNHEKDFYIWVPYDVNISPVKTDGGFELVTPEDGKVEGNVSSNNKDYTALPDLGDENFFSYIQKGISSFTSNISYIFRSVGTIFNGFNEGLQTFFITIFFLSLALFIIRFLF